jgi:hypothetical protein
MVPLVEVLADSENEKIKNKYSEKHIDDVKKRAAFAQDEIDKGFPVIIGHAVVSFWSAMETFTHDLVISFLLNEDKILQNEMYAKIKIPLFQYEQLDKESRMHYLVQECSRTTNAVLKPGVSRFETLLESIGLSGSVDDSIKRDIYEMQQVRNLIVHKSSVVDKRFVDACPWLKASIGEKYTVSYRDYKRYVESLSRYMYVIIDRLRVYFGHEPYKEDEEKES